MIVLGFMITQFLFGVDYNAEDNVFHVFIGPFYCIIGPKHILGKDWDEN
jgi:hypothetical protein